MPFPDFGVVEVERGRFASLHFLPRHHSGRHASIRAGMVVRGTQQRKTEDLCVFLKSLRLPPVGCPLPDESAMGSVCWYWVTADLSSYIRLSLQQDLALKSSENLLALG